MLVEEAKAWSTRGYSLLALWHTARPVYMASGAVYEPVTGPEEAMQMWSGQLPKGGSGGAPLKKKLKPLLFHATW